MQSLYQDPGMGARPPLGFQFRSVEANWGAWEIFLLGSSSFCITEKEAGEDAALVWRPG